MNVSYYRGRLSRVTLDLSCDLARHPGLGLPRLLPILPCSLAEAVGRGLAAQQLSRQNPLRSPAAPGPMEVAFLMAPRLCPS